MTKKSESKSAERHGVHIHFDKPTLEALKLVQSFLRSWGQPGSQSAAVRFSILRTVKNMADGVG